MRSYSELILLPTLEERYEYLRTGDGMPEYDEIVMREYEIYRKAFYTSDLWRRTRREIILRDDGNELGVYGYPINGHIAVHHLNPISIDDIRNGSYRLTDPENLISASDIVHKAIHYGDKTLIPAPPIERKPGDTKLW